MTRVGWLVDEGKTLGGAELTQAEFRAAAPAGVEIVDCPPGEVPGCDRYVIHNCVTYSLADIQATGKRPTTKFWHDVGPHVQPEVRAWIDRHATQVCCSPIQAEYMGLDVQCIPPPVDLDRFRAAAESVNGSRADRAVCVGSWRNFGKAPHKAAEWAAGNGGIDFYGTGVFAPRGSQEIPYEEMPQLLASYRTFVHLPTVIEPFGRVVAEAWASGCDLVVNGLVGAKYWIAQQPDAIETAASDFWDVVLNA